MDIYTRKSLWKWYLAAAGVLIVILSLWYTKNLADQLAEREKQQVEQYLAAQRLLGKAETDPNQFFNCDVSFPLQVVQANTTVPILLIGDNGKIDGFVNIGEDSMGFLDPVDVEKIRVRMVEEGADTMHINPTEDVHQIVMYSKSRLLMLLEWYPYIQLLLISAFIFLGYMGFSSARRAEQNQVWLGMAKETAHQLGTPITAILGWIETLKAVNEDRPDNQEMLMELGNDVSRLELVADRFSKIGATPELTPVNLYEELEACRAYMQRRAPRRVSFEFPNPSECEPLLTYLNPPLFDWVVENLLRNAIDAMEDGQGTISGIIYQEGNWACIDISDTGKGIPGNKYNTVFKPGYSTKTRGWGLGLSLSRRIIVEYHKGKIFVKKSELGKGTTFTIKLRTGKV
ncbi:MAG: HAMP domain-containing sensor histidine kinase [Saprospiraceae bacterium]|nr:HAMP domain-containing histidine kinase [Saprospiraceae bacterium]MCB9343879.1 HAMP domain-containing histidine kinase [Lewinellaceae bacterium]